MASGHHRLGDANSRLYHSNFTNAETIVHPDVPDLSIKSNCLSVSLGKKWHGPGSVRDVAFMNQFIISFIEGCNSFTIITKDYLA